MFGRGHLHLYRHCQPIMSSLILRHVLLELRVMAPTCQRCTAALGVLFALSPAPHCTLVGCPRNLLGRQLSQRHVRKSRPESKLGAYACASVLPAEGPRGTWRVGPSIPSVSVRISEAFKQWCDALQELAAPGKPWTGDQ